MKKMHDREVVGDAVAKGSLKVVAVVRLVEVVNAARYLTVCSVVVPDSCYSAAEMGREVRAGCTGREAVETPAGTAALKDHKMGSG